MINMSVIDFTDFSFNGSFLTSFDGFVGGRGGFKNFSAIPSRDTTTEKLIGIDGELVVSSKLNPRTFAIPIFINDLADGKIRDLAVWLDTEEPKIFYWKDDTVYIKCMLDSGGIDFENIFDTKGLTELKFIAYDPFYYLITPTLITDTLTQPSDFTSIVNLGNKLSFPKVKILGSGTITIKSLDSAENELTSGVITGVAGHVFIDSLEKRVYSVAGSVITNLINNWTGTFPVISTGTVKLTFSGAGIISNEITPRFRWI